MSATSVTAICRSRGLIMHCAVGGDRIVFNVIVALVLLFLCGGPTLSLAAGKVVGSGAAYAAEDDEVVRLAEQAKAAFRSRMEPPPIKITIWDIMLRDQTAIIRDFARESHDTAVDALVAESRKPGRANGVTAALRQLVDTGRAERAEAIFKEMLDRKGAGGQAKPEAAAAARHGVALIELPAALAPVINLPSEARPLPPLGEKAEPAYARAADLDPDDPWNWVVLAWLTDKTEIFGNSLEVAERAKEPRAAIAALHVFGLFRAWAGEYPRAEQAYDAALAVAREWTNGAPESTEAQRYLALSLNRLADALRAQKRYDGAAAAYQEAYAVRHRLAEAEPDDPRRQIDLIAAHMNLWLLSTGRGEKIESNSEFEEAGRLYRALAAGDPFAASYDPANSGGVGVVLTVAGSLTLAIGLIALARYRRVIARCMKAAAEAGGISVPGAPASRPPMAQNPGDLPLRSLEATEARKHAGAFRSATVASAIQASRRAAWVYTIAGIAFALVGCVLWLHLGETEITWPRALGKALPLAWPVVLTLALLWGPDRRRLGLLLIGYFGVLLAFCTRIAFSDTPPLEMYGVTVPPFAQPLIVFATDAAPTLFLLVFLNRRIRAIGPVLLTLMIILAIGSQLAMIGASTYVGMSMMSRLSALLGNALPAITVLLIVDVLGMLLFLPVGWLAISWLRRLYDAKAFSEQTLVFNSIWLFQALILCSATVYWAGLLGWLGLGAFAVYKLIVWIGLRPLAKAAARRSPARLLLLRTFGFRRRSERFFDLLGARWRYAGPIQLISAPDLAGRSIDPDEFMDFLSGRLRHRFVIEPGDLERRFGEVDNRPDPDGRYRVNEFFCGNDAWRPAVTRLMAESDLVAMDLRGFSPANEGCLFELQSLVDTVPVARVVVLTDRSTDVPFLRQILGECWRHMDAGSPNQRAPGALTLLATGRREVAAVAALLAIADEVVAARETSARPAAPALSAAPAQ